MIDQNYLTKADLIVYDVGIRYHLQIEWVCLCFVYIYMCTYKIFICYIFSNFIVEMI